MLYPRLFPRITLGACLAESLRGTSTYQADRGAHLPDLREVPLPADLCAAVENKYRSHFSGIEELLVFVLKDLASDSAITADETELHLIDERLRDLGYL